MAHRRGDLTVRGTLAIATALVATVALAGAAPAATPVGWTHQLGTSGAEVGRALAITSTGDVYQAGSTDGTFPGATTADGTEVVVVRYDKNGGLTWVREFGSSDNDDVFGAAATSDGGVVVAGTTPGDMPGNTTKGSIDGFLARFAKNGNRKWLVQFGTAGIDQVTSVAVAASGAIYVAGTTSGDLDGPNAGGGGDAFVAKFDKNGKQKWARQLGSTGYDRAWGLALSRKEEVVIAGQAAQALPENVHIGAADAFVAKYDKNGVRQWVSQFGTTSDDLAYGVAVAKAGDIRLSGFTEGGLDGSPAGGPDVFVSRFETGGDISWTTQFGTTEDDEAAAIALDSSGNAFVTGWTRGSLAGFANAGNADLIAARLDADGAIVWTRQLGTPGYDEGFAIAVRKNDTSGGKIVIGGDTDGSVFGHTSAGSTDLIAVALHS